MLTMYPEEVFAVRAIRAGAAGYINKKSAPEELIAAIKKVLAGGRYVSASLAERLAGELNRSAAGLPHECLSNRELQVMRLIASGKSVKEIAGELSLSEKTVGTYRTRVQEKLGMKSPVEITRYAMRHKLVE
jgi:DNA-binding NarL/FixJ family response regulator